MSRDFASIIDAEIIGIRARHTVRLAAEHARRAQERQAEIDAAIVAERERRVQASRERDRFAVRRVTA